MSDRANIEALLRSFEATATWAHGDAPMLAELRKCSAEILRRGDAGDLWGAVDAALGWGSASILIQVSRLVRKGRIKRRLESKGGKARADNKAVVAERTLRAVEDEMRSARCTERRACILIAGRMHAKLSTVRDRVRRAKKRRAQET